MSCISKNHVLKIETEDDLQKEVVAFLREKYPNVLFTATCRGFQETPKKRLDMFELGFCKSVPDLLIFEPNSSHSGIAIELKTPKATGHLSEHQLEFMMNLKKRGWQTLISNDFSDIVIKITKYMDNQYDQNDEDTDDDEDDKQFLRQQTFATHYKKYHT